MLYLFLCENNGEVDNEEKAADEAYKQYLILGNYEANNTFVSPQITTLLQSTTDNRLRTLVRRYHVPLRKGRTSTKPRYGRPRSEGSGESEDLP